uniref:GBD/FH3 domain-containing protein n=1 Tax=Rhodnius prolixus TaxID=13249 RepID=T1HBU3_RHOPR
MIPVNLFICRTEHFVQEFVSPGFDGVTHLLELLKSVQSTQGNQTARRQNMVEELSCLQCLAHCLRCPDTPRRLALSSAGLFTLSAAIMSNLNKSRILALQILRKICEEPGGSGFVPVSDAMSTMRLKYGEPVRFKFLCGMLNSASPELLVAGIAFINSFVESAPCPQARLYVQAELEQAGYNPDLLAKNLSLSSSNLEPLRNELLRWQNLYIDINKLKYHEGQLVKEVHMLKDKIKNLEKQLQILHDEKSLASTNESRLKSRCIELEREISSLRGLPTQGGSTPAEDEGISSSGQDDGIEREPLIYEMYTVNNDVAVTTKEKDEEDTTIDEVIEELENIINDAETDYKDGLDTVRIKGKTALAYYTRYLQRSDNDLFINGLGNESEAEIVPEKIVPHPPRRSKSLFLEKEYNNNNLFFEDNESQENSHSVLSTSNEQLTQVFYNSSNKTYNQRDRNHLKRRETFHCGLYENQQKMEIKPEIKSRRGSLDAVFYYTDIEQNKNSTKIYIESHEERRKSRSIDRISDGIDALADIVVTEDTDVYKGKLTEPIPLQRNFGINKKSGTSQQTLSSMKCDDIKYAADRTVFLPVRNEPSPSPTPAQMFTLQRGRLNAGLYSGQSSNAPRVTISPIDYYNRHLTGVNLSISTGKLSDFPSGLY